MAEIAPRALNTFARVRVAVSRSVFVSFQQNLSSHHFNFWFHFTSLFFFSFFWIFVLFSDLNLIRFVITGKWILRRVSGDNRSREFVFAVMVLFGGIRFPFLFYFFSFLFGFRENWTELRTDLFCFTSSGFGCNRCCENSLLSSCFVIIFSRQPNRRIQFEFCSDWLVKYLWKWR